MKDLLLHKHDIVSGLEMGVVRMLCEKPERGANDASLLAATQGLFQPPAGHPFPTLDLAKNDGLTVYSNYIDFALFLPVISFNNDETARAQVRSGTFFSDPPTLPRRVHR